MIPSIAIGIVGMVMAIVNYPTDKNLLASRKAKYAARNLAISEKLMNR